jgi:anti-anti-sigma factor
MSQPTSKVSCPLLVLKVQEPQISGDNLADALRDELLNLYEASTAVHVILDMSHVRYLSSAGIRPLLSLNRKVREREGRLILAALQTEVEGVLSATRLITIGRSGAATFESQPDVAEAVSALFGPEKA